MDGIWLFLFGLFLGTALPTFGLWIAMRRNEELRRQLRIYMNPDVTPEELDKIFDGKV